MVIKPTKDDKSGEERKFPDFIFIDNGQKDEEPIHLETEEEKDQRYQQSFQRIEGVRFPFFVRILALMGAIVVFILAMIAFALFLFALCLTVLTLFLSPDINNRLKSVWNQFRKLIVICLGLLIAVFSPPLGMGLIVLDFMFHGEKISNSFMSRFMR